MDSNCPRKFLCKQAALFKMVDFNPFRLFIFQRSLLVVVITCMIDIKVLNVNSVRGPRKAAIRASLDDYPQDLKIGMDVRKLHRNNHLKYRIRMMEQGKNKTTISSFLK